MIQGSLLRLRRLPKPLRIAAFSFRFEALSLGRPRRLLRRLAGLHHSIQLLETSPEPLERQRSISELTAFISGDRAHTGGDVNEPHAALGRVLVLATRATRPERKFERGQGSKSRIGRPSNDSKFETF